MHKKLSRLIEPNLQPYFFCLATFAGVTAPFQPVLAAVELAALVLLYLLYRSQSTRRRHNVMRYIETITGGVDSISKNSMLNTPLPVVVFQADSGEIIWANEGFTGLTEAGEDVLDMRMGELAPDFDYQWILEGGQVRRSTELEGKTYLVYGAASRGGGRGAGQTITAYFVDFTESRHMQELYEASRLVTSVLVVDNYEELMKAGSEAAKSAIRAKIDEQINAWVTGSGGLLLKYTRDRYLFVSDEQFFRRMVEEKFSVLETIHQVVSEDGVAASLSVGIGKDWDSCEESFRWAEKSIEMALSRGGDQAVVRDSLDFQFYGGRSKSTEKRTKVKSRVMAKALGELIADAGQVYVMGHEYADMDAVGAAAGVCCAARKKGKRAQIVIDMEGNNARPLVRKLEELPEYRDVFVSGPDAFLHAQAGALLVVVDTNRPELVENRQLLDACNRVAVIDHHRRAADYIENAALNFHEPYASSASELVTELLQYLVEPSDLLRGEAEALLAGIVLDTKNFSMRAGSRTFEAAAFLRRAGADPAEVRRYFQSDLPSMIQRYDIIRCAKMVHGDIAVAVAEREVSRVTAAKAADDLLTLQGVQASVVLYRQGNGVSMSGRSLGEINVQVILESLGGGGNATSAGGHVPDSGLEEVRSRLLAAIDSYYAP
ncbi:MAG: DHH family phosphoesterase [Oscillospiraceae bacterium]|nr:DHH family phosphoesterase [Oscillospiraceae bacterium]MCI9392283.1 DHH family phosphoesterase [Oscillospiraceae bacterium]